jgi:peptidoglycan/LPS O-acetylase OafA/YrhL
MSSGSISHARPAAVLRNRRAEGLEVLTYDEYRESRYFRPLDGLRAVSVLLVLAYHVNTAAFGWLSGALGVAIFFVLSGFLITTLALREEERTGSVSLKAFYVRRACRIFPLYYVVLAIYVAVVVGLNWSHARSLMVKSLPYYLFYGNDFSPYLHQVGAPFTLSWSLGVEEKFYFLWPLLAFVLLRPWKQLRLVVPILLILTPLLADDSAAHVLHYSQIAVGCLLAFALNDRRSFGWLSVVARQWWAVLAAFVAVHALMHPYGATELRVLYAPVVALMVASVLLVASPWSRVLGTRGLVFVGKRAYGFYLVQMLCLAMCRPVLRHLDPGLAWNSKGEPTGHGAIAASLVLFVLAAVATLVFSDVLHRLVERPMITRGRIWSKQITGRAPIAPPRMSADEDALLAAPTSTSPAT